MTERHSVLLAGAAHLALLAGLSLMIVRPPQLLPRFQDATPVEVVTVADAPAVTEPPKPSMAAAPREVAPPPEAAPPEPVIAPAPPPPDVSDAPAQDVAPEPPKPRVAKPAASQPPMPKPVMPKPLDTGSLASLIDKALPRALKPTRDASAFAKSIESAIPQGARIDARAMASLEQAIRGQIAPCWNPPLGGADVAAMTAVLRIRLGRDGAVAAAPEFVGQTGATTGNAAYARAFVETAKRAVLRCAPLKLPPDLFPYWREFELNFDPRLMT